MSADLIILPDAEADLVEAFAWYESQRNGLGHDLLLSVEACLASIRRMPELHPTVRGEVQRALIHRFPYGIFYLVDQQQVVVLAVMHAKRDPSAWQRRLGRD